MWIAFLCMLSKRKLTKKGYKKRADHKVPYETKWRRYHAAQSYDTKLNGETKSALESERIYRSILIYLYK